MQVAFDQAPQDGGPFSSDDPAGPVARAAISSIVANGQNAVLAQRGRAFGPWLGAVHRQNAPVGYDSYRPDWDMRTPWRSF